jgi:hypothetical protein
LSSSNGVMCLHRPPFSCTMQFVSLPDTWWCRRAYRPRVVHVFNRDFLSPVRCPVQLPPRARSLRLCLGRQRLDDREHRARWVDHHTEAADARYVLGAHWDRGAKLPGTRDRRVYVVDGERRTWTTRSALKNASSCDNPERAAADYPQVQRFPRRWPKAPFGLTVTCLM